MNFSEKIVLGLGGTVDYEVRWAPIEIENIARELGILVPDLMDVAEVSSERELLISLLNFVQAGIGGERYVTDPAIIHSIADRVPFRVTLGGTPVRAALAMAIRGVESTVHLVSTNDETRAMLPAGTQILSSAKEDSLFPHLIFQYPANSRIDLLDGKVVSPRANRLIYTHDPPNEKLLLADGLSRALSKCSLFLISGLNIFQSERLLLERLGELTLSCARLPGDAVVVYEDAGFHLPEQSQIVRDTLLPYIQVYSLNEDEAQLYVGRSVDLTEASDVALMIRQLRDTIPASNLLVHTHLWSVLVGHDSARFAGPLVAAVQMASARYIFGDSLTIDQYNSVPSFPYNPSALAIEKAVKSDAGVPCVFSPGFSLETEAPTTIGLGDSFIGGFIAELALQDERESG
jgi:hypothetical protein